MKSAIGSRFRSASTLTLRPKCLLCIPGFPLRSVTNHVALFLAPSVLRYPSYYLLVTSNPSTMDESWASWLGDQLQNNGWVVTILNGTQQNRITILTFFFFAAALVIATKNPAESSRRGLWVIPVDFPWTFRGLIEGRLSLKNALMQQILQIAAAASDIGVFFTTIGITSTAKADRSNLLKFEGTCSPLPGDSSTRCLGRVHRALHLFNSLLTTSDTYLLKGVESRDCLTEKQTESVSKSLQPYILAV
jgi:hypothetical protein